MGMNNIELISNIMFTVVPILMVLFFIFFLLMMFSTKFRGKMMGRQMKAIKHMTDYVKEDMEDALTNLGSITANAQNNIINQNEDILKNVATKTAEINKDAVRTTASAIKEGFSQTNTIYCKHCGAMIDADSRFCKSCGKEQ